MDDYLNLFREMISLRSLTEHTAKSYSTYIKTYLFYLSEILHKTPEEVSWSDLREFVRWLQREKSLSDRTINHCISQLRFFTLYVLHKPWDPSQLPINSERSHPFVPEKKNTSPIQISAVSPRLGTILKNHIQSNSVIFQSCSFCLL